MVSSGRSFVKRAGKAQIATRPPGGARYVPESIAVQRGRYRPVSRPPRAPPTPTVGWANSPVAQLVPVQDVGELRAELNLTEDERLGGNWR